MKDTHCCIFILLIDEEKKERGNFVACGFCGIFGIWTTNRGLSSRISIWPTHVWGVT